MTNPIFQNRVSSMKKLILLFSILFSFSLLAKPSSKPAPKLAAEKELTCQVVKQTEKLMLSQCDRLKVLTLKGTPVERAKMHGELMNSEIKRDVFNYFSERIFTEVEDANFIVRGVFKSIYNTWVEKFHKKTPKNFLEEIEAQAVGAKVEKLALQRAIALPDTSAFLVNMPERGFFKTFVSFGCTSVAKKTADGRFVYGRNLDFASTTIFDEYPLMTIQIPEEGSKELKHITFGADGMQFGGITGVNEAGISFAVHQYMTKDAEKFGVPMFLIGEAVLREARSLDEAVEIIRKNRPGPLWAFIVTDLNKQDTWVVEASSQNFQVRKMEGDTFAQTNHILAVDKTAEMANAGFLKNSLLRFDKVLEMAKPKKSFSATDAAKILSFQADRNGELSASEDIIKGETIQTLIFESQQNKKTIHISIDPAPASSGRYAQFDLASLFYAPEKMSYSVKDLSQTPNEKRQNQMKLAKATHHQDMGKIEESMKLFLTQKTPDAQIFQAVGYYNLKKYEDATKMTTELKKKTSKDTLTGQSVLWIELLSLNKQKKSKEAKVLAEEILKLKVEDQDLQKIAKKISQGKSLDDGDEALRFSLFSGYITNQIFQ